MSVTEQILQEFPAVSPEKWEELFLKETKQENIQVQSSYLGFEFLPFYATQNNYAEQAAFLQQLSVTREEHWYINRYISIEDKTAANRYILQSLNKGVSSITLVGDLHSEKEAEIVLREVMADYIEINFFSSSPLETAKNYYTWCSNKGISSEKIFGAFYCDPLADALRHGGWKNGKEKDLDLLAECVRRVQQHSGKMKAITVDATVYHYAGASLVQTIGYTLAHAIEYIDAMKTRGIEPATTIERMVFKWPCGTSFFAEIAALRALRLLWNNLCRHITGNTKTLYKACVHAETSLHSWSVADMYNNMLRATTQCMSAIAGGAHTVHVHPYNVVSTHANDFSERMSANVQLLLREESFFGKTVDPAAGSQLVEALTHQLAEKALALLKKTEAAGGLLVQIQAGVLQKELLTNMEKMVEAVKKGEIKVLGANLYPNKNEDLSQIPRNDLFDHQATRNEFPALKMQRLAAVLENN